MESRNTSPVFFISLIMWMVVIVALAFTLGVDVAVYALVATLVALAVARFFLPAGMVPQIRSRAVDVATLLIFAAVLAYFAAWADTPAIYAL